MSDCESGPQGEVPLPKINLNEIGMTYSTEQNRSKWTWQVLRSESLHWFQWLESMASHCLWSRWRHLSEWLLDEASCELVSLLPPSVRKRHNSNDVMCDQHHLPCVCQVSEIIRWIVIWLDVEFKYQQPFARIENCAFESVQDPLAPPWGGGCGECVR